MSELTVRVTYDETWRRQQAVVVDLDELREWAGERWEPDPETGWPGEQLIREFLEADADAPRNWHNGVTPADQDGDEFVDIDFDVIEPLPKPREVLTAPLPGDGPA